MPLAQLRVLGLLTGDGGLHNGAAEMINHRRDGKDAAKPVDRLFSRVVRLRRFSQRAQFALALELKSSIFVPFDQARLLRVCPLRLEI